MPEPERIYWDANCFTYYINEDMERLPNLEAILDRVQRSDGKVQIVTSTISKVEVAFSLQEQAKRELSEDEESRIANLWADTSVVKLVEPHELIIDDARMMIRIAMTKGLALRAADAIHLASAKRIEAKEFHTVRNFGMRSTKRWPGYRLTLRKQSSGGYQGSSAVAPQAFGD